MNKTLKTGACALTLAVLLSACQSLPGVRPAASAGDESGVAVIHTRFAESEVQVLPVPAAPAGDMTSLPESTPPADVWDRMRRGFILPDLEDPRIEQYARDFARKGYFERVGRRAERYLFYFLEEIEARGLPTELALLPFVESAMNPAARSPVGAAGLWQFMPATGRRFDMRVSHLIDERRSVADSTHGAIAYLSELATRFDGDWFLALASYNWGEARVERAVARNRAAGLPATYSAIRMPAETRNYVPQLLALKALVLQPGRYGASLPAIANAPYFRAVDLRQDIDVVQVRRLSGISEAEFFALNAAVRRPLVMTAATPRLWLPHEAADRLEAGLARERSSASYTLVRLERTESLAAIARRHQTSSATLRSLNAIPAGMKPRAGSTLIVPAAGPARPVSERQVDSAVLAYVPDLVRITVKVRKGERLIDVARRTPGVSYAQLQRWNPKVKAKGKLPSGTVLIAWVVRSGERQLSRIALPQQSA